MFSSRPANRNVSRRAVLKWGAASSMGVGALGLAAAAGPGQLAGGRSAAMAQQAPFSDLEEATLADLRAALDGGQMSVRELVDAYLARIDAIDRAGPRLNSVIEVNPEAQAIADALDAELQSGAPRGPLHGIPVLLKDNIDTADQMLTTAGSLALVDSRPAQDAFVAQRLREAGAVLLGKTTLSEWANFRSTPLDERLERPGRAMPQPLRARPQPVRVQLRVGGGGLGQPLRRRGRHRDRRLDRLPLGRRAASSGSSRPSG